MFVYVTGGGVRPTLPAIGARLCLRLARIKINGNGGTSGGVFEPLASAAGMTEDEGLQHALSVDFSKFLEKEKSAFNVFISHWNRRAC